MRIISGLLKGKSINFTKNSITRPLKDSVKENIFNILQHSNLINIRVKNAKILDLYSGIGSFGLECISRGAKKVKFVEQNKISSKILKENLNFLSIKYQAELVNDSVENFLKKKNDNKYDIIFLDPPFSDQLFINNLRLIKNTKIYEKNYIVIIHREKKTIENFGEFFNTILVKKYGRSKIIFGIFN